MMLLFFALLSLAFLLRLALLLLLLLLLCTDDVKAQGARTMSHTHAEGMYALVAGDRESLATAIVTPAAVL